MLNALRGEGRVTLNGNEYDLVIDMDGLARVSQVIAGRSLGEAVQAILGAEPRAMQALLSTKANKGISDAIISGMDLFAVGEGAQQAVTELMGPVEGNEPGETPKPKP